MMLNRRRNSGGRSGADGSGGKGGKVRAKKHLGQHFLKDLGIAQRIVDALQPIAETSVGCKADGQTAVILNDPERSEGESKNLPLAKNDQWKILRPRRNCAQDDAARKLHTLEVGPGMGVLTQFLMQRPDIDLAVAEIDPESVEYLRQHYPALKIIEGDFLRMNLEELPPKDGAEKELHIIGNFPYNISSQIFFKVLEHRDMVPQVVGMVQREVAVRIAEPAGSRDYGILSVLLQAWYDIEYLFTVSEGVFDPPPKVKSAVIRLTRNTRTELGCDEKLFKQTVKAAFGQRRKMVRNALKAAFDLPAEADHRFLSMRAEQLTVENFIELTKWIVNKLPPRG